MAQRLKELAPDDAWRGHVAREAGKEIGAWLEGRGRLHHPIARLTLAELEAMADNAISRFIVLASARMMENRPEDTALIRFLRGDAPAPCADAKLSDSSSTRPSPEPEQAAGGSVPCAALVSGQPSCGAEAT